MKATPNSLHASVLTSIPPIPLRSRYTLGPVTLLPSRESLDPTPTLPRYCPNDNSVIISANKGSNQFQEQHKLSEHDAALFVTGIDWAPKSNRIVTCSQDRNAYVWTLDGGAWKPTLVILRINRAATDVKWSPKENKFAVASGARCVSVCYFEEENDWWVSKHIKKGIRSTVTTIDWHPNNVLIATGTTDFKVRLFSGIVKGVDKKLTQSPWGNTLAFGACTREIDVGGHGWVHGVRFSPSGNRLAIVSHNSSVTFAEAKGEDAPQVQTIFTTDLPFRCCLFLTENAVVGAGYDCNPMLFQYEGSGWVFKHKLDQQKKAEAKGPQTGTSAAFKMFQQQASKGTTAADKTVTTLTTRHQNCITSLAPMKRATNGDVTDFSSAGLDGRLVVWQVKTLEQTIAGLKIE